MTKHSIIDLGIQGLQETLREKQGGRLGRAPRLMSRKKISRYWIFRHASIDLDPGDALIVVSPDPEEARGFLRAVAGISPPDEGEIHLDGRALLALTPRPRVLQSLSVGQSVRVLAGLYGLTDTEVDEHFDKICKVARVRKFIHEPIDVQDREIRRQIAFAIAVTAPFEVICLDRIAIVGNPKYRTRCLPHLRNSLAEGKTLVIYTSKVAVAKNLGTKAILLGEEQSQVIAIEDAVEQLRNERRARRDTRRKVRQRMRELDDDDA